MTVAPAQSPIWAHSDRTRYMRHITFSFQDEAVASLLDEDVHPTRAFAPRFNFFDARLLHIARLFEIECASDELTDTLYGDGLAMALLLRLASFDGLRRQPPARGGLTSRQLRQVTEYLAEHLADSIHLQDLAGITQLSRSHFSRAFRVSTGLPPHQWLLQERVRRAKEQLRARHLSVSEIALVTGFADQAHFTRTFRRVVGASPAAWRRHLGP
jgi:AraC family transcriptional regulator